jgi:hypothetical protein
MNGARKWRPRRYDEETLAELRERLLEAERGDPWPEWFTEDRVDVRWPKWDSAQVGSGLRRIGPTWELA